MNDLYTKVILTAIVALLCVIALQYSVRPASALNENCGEYSYDPCYVRLVN